MGLGSISRIVLWCDAVAAAINDGGPLQICKTLASAPLPHAAPIHAGISTRKPRLQHILPPNPWAPHKLSLLHRAHTGIQSHASSGHCLIHVRHAVPGSASPFQAFRLSGDWCEPGLEQNTKRLPPSTRPRLCPASQDKLLVRGIRPGQLDSPASEGLPPVAPCSLLPSFFQVLSPTIFRPTAT
jgi:hypothetical protein